MVLVLSVQPWAAAVAFEAARCKVGGLKFRLMSDIAGTLAALSSGSSRPNSNVRKNVPPKLRF